MLYRRVSITFVILILLVIILLLWRSSWRPSLKTPWPLTYHNRSGIIRKTILSESCEIWIQENIRPDGMTLLIDEHVLTQLRNNLCNQMRIISPVKIAVDTKTTESERISNGSFEIIQFSNKTDKDYLDFGVDKHRRIIPKSFNFQIIGNLMVPTQISLFLEFWRRGTFVNCRNMTMNRDSSRNKYLMFFRNFFFPPRKSIPALESVQSLAKLRDEMLGFGIFPFLNGGTFLGWYRECSVIPHTTDMDIVIFEENWNNEFYKFLWSHNSTFRVKRQLGLVNDSYELTLVPKNGFRTPIDVFLMYKEKNDGKESRWVGGLTTAGVKYKYIYPDYDPWCAADLLGHLFWVPCTPEEKIQKEYGYYWFLDENSSKYIWNAARNSIENGRFTKKQMETETYNEYKMND